MRTAFLLVTVSLVTTMTFAQTGSKQIVKVGADLDLPFSPAVKAGGFIYVSGSIALGEDGKVAGSDVKAQTKRTLDNISKILAAAGSSVANAVSVMVYIRSASDFAAMNEVYRTYWPKDPPA